MKKSKVLERHWNCNKMITKKVWVCLLLMGIIGINAEVSREVTAEDLIVPGIYEDLVEETPVLYTSYVPIIFELKKPTWENLSLNWTEVENCTETTNGSHIGNPCPTGYYLKEILRNSNPQLFSLLNFTSLNSTSSKTGNLLESLSCEKISPHFKSGLYKEIDADSYISMLNACSRIRETIINQTLTSNDALLSKLVLDQALAAFNDSFSSHIKFVDNSIAEALLVNFYATLKGILLGNLIMDNELWKEAFSSCASHQLPRMMINESDLVTALKTVQDKIITYKLELSVPINEAFKLYDLKLTDCAFTTRQTYLIRLLIPVRSPEVYSFQLNTLYPLPSMFQTDIGYKLCEPINIPSKQVQAVNNNERYAVSCQDDKNSLCYVSLGLSDELIDDHSFQCTRALAKNVSLPVILKYCKTRLQCSSFDIEESPYYRKLNSDTVFISRVSEDFERYNLSIWCKGQWLRNLPVSKNPSEFLISLPCDCEILENRHKAFVPTPPCRNTTLRTPTLNKLLLPDFILQPKYLLPNESAILLTELRTRMQKLEVALEAATEQSLSALSNRGLYVALVVLLLIIIVVLFLWGLQLWRWKRSTMRGRANYVMFDQTAILHDDAAL